MNEPEAVLIEVAGFMAVFTAGFFLLFIAALVNGWFELTIISFITFIIFSLLTWWVYKVHMDMSSPRETENANNSHREE